MASKPIRPMLFIACVFISMLTMACGTKYNVKGQVVDASTNAPIEGASIGIHWSGQDPKAYLAPYTDGRYRLEETKIRSDKNGYFIIPQYPLAASFSIGAYKKGYVCWDDHYIFQKGKQDIYSKRIAIKKESFQIKHGMVIKMEPFTKDYYKPTHARFTINVSESCGGLEGIEEEIAIYYKYYIRK